MNLTAVNVNRFGQPSYEPQAVMLRGNSTAAANIRLKEIFKKGPERYISNSFVKIGYFESNSDLRYQDVITGNLFHQLDRTIELLFSKYTKAYIRYEGIQRIEEAPFPYNAMREIVTNAIIHRDYGIPATTQIRVYEDRVIVFNDGDLPSQITIESLNKEHKSIPRNPNIANAFFLAGNIEAWGRGTNKVFDECESYGIPKPVYRIHGKVIEVHIQGKKPEMSVKNVGEMSVKNVGETEVLILKMMQENPKISIIQLAQKIGVNEKTIERKIKVLQENKMLVRLGGAKGGEWKILQT